jgi:hypothetical protein
MGNQFFSAVFGLGLSADEVKPLMAKVKTLMQKTHPEKAVDYEYHPKQMKQCNAWIKSGIPLPTPTHQANEKVVLKLTYPK